ncbi:S-layer homology domain-containing protein [Candidatus Peregrinibacteria bacterium]|nr:S-layer homology domain-containing protein [Candidatus Peregrinibacteria bacterium]
MWKKLLAILAIIGMFSTSAVYAQVNVPDYITNLTVVPNVFVPSVGETVKVDFDVVNGPVDLYDYVIDSNSNVVFVFDDKKTTNSGHVSRTWYGKAQNDPNGLFLADGVYTIKAHAFINNALLDTKLATVNLSSVVAGAPKISGLKADPSSFSPKDKEDTSLSFSADKDGYLTVQIKDDRNTLVRTFADYDGNTWYKNTESHSVNWNGKDDNGNVVPDGDYTVLITSKNDSGQNFASMFVNVGTTVASTVGNLKNVTVDPKSSWNPAKESLTLEFKLLSTVKTLNISAKSGNKVVEILNEKKVEDGLYTETWDGTDDEGDYVDAGNWDITVRADGDKVVKTVSVSYPTPNVSPAVVAKSSFDPEQDEYAQLAFKVDYSADVTVDVYKGSVKEVTLVKDKAVKKNRWYTVYWKGTDSDGDKVAFGKDWKFKVKAKNPTDGSVYEVANVLVSSEEDSVSKNVTNVTNDLTYPLVVDKKVNQDVTFAYCLDSDASVFLAVYEGDSSSGKAKATLLDYVAQSGGCQEISWNLRDNANKLVKDGVYSYKIISKNGTHKDTETGVFMVGSSGGDLTSSSMPEDVKTVDVAPTEVPPPTVPVQVNPSTTPNCQLYYFDMAKADGELCEAITWATEKGIFTGYQDGTFKPYKDINRAEVLKVVLKAFNVNVMPLDGSSQGFGDVDSFAWYMPYVRTAKFYGMLGGYNNGTDAKLENNVNRVELLKFVLEASKQFTGYEFVNGYYYPQSGMGYADVSPVDPNTSWFYEYANSAFQYELYNSFDANGKKYLNPGQVVERGEVSLLLYRMYKAGLIK